MPERRRSLYDEAIRGHEKEIRALTVGQEYWFAVESFNESGVSRLSAPVRAAP